MTNGKAGTKKYLCLSRQEDTTDTFAIQLTLTIPSQADR
jgi:hypothetical protein